MRHVCWPVICTALASVAIGCDDSSSIIGSEGREYEAEAELAHVASFAVDGSLRIEALNGTVEVNGTDTTATISIRAVRRVEADSQEEADAGLQDLQVIIDSSSAGEFVVTTTQPTQSGNRNYIVDYAVVLPATARLHINQANGEVEVESISASVTVHSANGRIRLEDCTADVEARLGNGEIHAELTPSSGATVVLAVANGTIDLGLAGSTVGNLSADVSNGLVTVRGLTGDDNMVSPRSVRAVLGEGDGQITLTASNGRIDVYRR